MPRETQHKTILIPDDGTFPNNAVLPAILYVGAFLPFGADAAAEIEARFNANEWPAAWRNGIYDYHHYHSNAHEVLGVYSGWASIQLGGPDGPVVEFRAGDAAVLPAGTSHKRLDASPDFAVVGAYPPGAGRDMCLGLAGERPDADTRIAQVPLPTCDPVLGPHDGLVQCWAQGNN